ncbi:antibiotic biosynthesis monooxygenase [Novosphingobium sp. PC22D]|uniref:putative quinol monooxygenase n=1 Tax=Novosphingobium sp. PC22D TaxID=1962403 RepID=UPI000BEFE115|nr:antibiotic biosynthesis monooxygenase [Novosphingobium sp. PC22D]PEQ10711.1 antibiotic biosynthesis monooxygenase [Novosphingobium sp. PC22D]
MLLEIAEVETFPGREEQFAEAMTVGGGLEDLARCHGVVSVRFGRGIENPSTFTFNVVWTSVEDHIAARSLEPFKAFSARFADLTCGGKMNHYEMGELIEGVSA